jgi:hypothetical protein
LRVLCFTNMYPTETEPWEGTFVRELVEGRQLGVYVDVLAFDGLRRKRPTQKQPWCSVVRFETAASTSFTRTTA